MDIFLKYYCKIHEIARWYFIHAFVNFIITFIVIKPIYEIANDPIKELLYPTFYYHSTILIDILHIYHMLFFSCTKADIFHHLFFVSLGSIFVLTFNNGKYLALSHFFLCGLPGGIDYIFLFLYQCKYITKYTRLQIAAFLNNWIRAPGLCMILTVSLIKYLEQDKNIYTTIQLLLQIIMSYGNGQYYLKDVVYAYGRYSAINNS